MNKNLKSLTKLIEIESGTEWKVERRTRGKDAEGPDPSRPLQTWIIIIVNSMGHKQFVPEERVWTMFRLKDDPEAAAAPKQEVATTD